MPVFFFIVSIQLVWLGLHEVRVPACPPQAVPPDELEGLRRRQRERKELRRMLTIGWLSLLNGLLVLGVWYWYEVDRRSPAPVSSTPLAYGLALGILLTLLRLKEVRGSSVLSSLGPGLATVAGLAAISAYLAGLGLVLVIARPSLRRRLEELPMPAGYSEYGSFTSRVERLTHPAGRGG